MLAKILNLGGDGDKERWDIALKVVDSHPPETRFNIKDHKGIPDGDICPESRAVCNGKEGPIS